MHASVMISIISFVGFMLQTVESLKQYSTALSHTSFLEPSMDLLKSSLMFFFDFVCKF